MNTRALGRYYEDFEVGDIYKHPLGRTITDSDNVWFTLLTMNTNSYHFDYNYSSKSEFGKPLVNSALTIAIVLGLSVIDTSQNAFANLGMDKIRLTYPLFIGDTIYAESLVLSMRESESRPDSGIVTIKTRGLNQDGEQIVKWERAFYIYKRGAPAAESPFPAAKTPLESE